MFFCIEFLFLTCIFNNYINENISLFTIPYLSAIVAVSETPNLIRRPGQKSHRRCYSSPSPRTTLVPLYHQSLLLDFQQTETTSPSSIYRFTSPRSSVFKKQIQVECQKSHRRQHHLSVAAPLSFLPHYQSSHWLSTNRQLPYLPFIGLL
jgi:hypothetical protein